ncbi:MAG: methyltransferase domain-containing protein [Alteromonadaceae bacterium]|nr:methyltransferase domain-containing protein [Alteromonadaceae bacterium]
MKPALAFRQPHFPNSWQDLPNGELILEEINQQLSPWWYKFFGYHLLKIGSLSGAINSEECSIRNQVTLSTSKMAGHVMADVDDLPFLDHSVDVCILSHALEFALDPHHVVREANRVLIPNGYLVLTGFNPISLAGFNKLIPHRRNQMPWNERFFSPMRVKDWLNLMGYEILSDQRCIHSTLGNTSKNGGYSQYWRKFANKYLSNLGSVYVIIAKKRVLPLTPIKPKWKLQSAFRPGKVETAKVSPIISPQKRNR